MLHLSLLIICSIACISCIVNLSVFIQLVQPGEHAGGEDDTQHLQQGQAQADRSNHEQVLGELGREPGNSDGKGKTDKLEVILCLQSV